ncbi:Flp pilus assembly protein CpaB [Sphingomonas nostoxanthinifaciens]|uniref:Flp pilus assembly protein CpaB n=1 Tax=Sphingomonas nostoxanthinifaciens TaxID=2872652 RepID=UPI001CC1D5E9|nr:Flp pilus assembly protein CpaB [Sphingomonas nostoxanthinifaciens]UAK24104.1 Flp pilus assembly protein CpaB [Sphingomonas nostoxanthinifaciens]
MDVRKLMLMVGALVFAAVCAVTVHGMLGGSAAPQAQAAVPPTPTGPEVLVATRPLQVGTIVAPDAFRYQPWPKDLVERAYYLKGQQPAQALIGTVVRYAITAGQPITQGSLIKPGDRGFLAAALGPGMRAVTISVSAQSGVAGFVFPGDRVDILLTQAVAGGGDGQPLKVAETIVRNVRVLATDQRTDKAADDNGKTVVTAFSNVTLETTPKLSEKIAVAQSVGQLSLSLRSIADDRMELEREIAAGEVNVPDTTDPKAEKAMMLQLASRPSDGDASFSTGADVSRFQRANVPGKPEAGAPAGPVPGPASSAAAPRGSVVVVARGANVTSTPVGSF